MITLDGAGWHQKGDKLKVPNNLSLLPLPSYSPELNPQENVWQFLRQNYLPNRVYDTYNELVDACAEAWNAFVAIPDRITSIAQESGCKRSSRRAADISWCFRRRTLAAALSRARADTPRPWPSSRPATPPRHGRHRQLSGLLARPRTVVECRHHAKPHRAIKASLHRLMGHADGPRDQQFSFCCGRRFGDVKSTKPKV